MWNSFNTAAPQGLSAGVTTIAGAQGDPARDRPQQGDLLVRVGDTTRTPLTVDSLEPGAGQVLA